MNLAEPIFKMFRKTSVPKIEVGDVVRVHQKIREGNKERIQVFEGIVIAMHKRESLDATFTVRKIASGVGVERTYLLHSPNITKVEFKRSSNVRRAKLYYLRALTGKALKMKDREVTKSKWEELLVSDEAQTEATEADIAEAVEAEEQKHQAEESAESAQEETVTEAPIDETIEAPESNTASGEAEAEVSDDQDQTPTENQDAESTNEGDGADSQSSGN